MSRTEISLEYISNASGSASSVRPRITRRI